MGIANQKSLLSRITLRASRICCRIWNGALHWEALRFWVVIWPGCHQCTQDEYDTAQPEPVNERVTVNLKSSTLRGNWLPIYQQDIEIIFPCAAHAWNSHWLLGLIIVIPARV